MWLETLHKPEKDQECCPTCRGGVQRRTYGEVYAGAFIQDGQRLEIRRVPATGYYDPVVLDPLTQYFDGGLYRIWPSERYYSRGGKKLHRKVWECAFGSIPKGHHIHHKDANTANNSLSNLECLPAKENLAEMLKRTSVARKTRGFGAKAREAAAAWHKSEEGRLWHKRHAERQKTWTKWKREQRACLECGKEFLALIRASGRSQKYCSRRCGVKASVARRKKPAPPVACAFCSQPFEASYGNQKFCCVRCRELATNRRRKRKRQSTSTCRECGKTFADPKGNRKYCFEGCAKTVAYRQAQLRRQKRACST